MAEEFTPTTETELARFVAENAGSDQPRPLVPVGGRTALIGATAADGVVVGTSGLADVVDHPVRDMTITVGAGVRIDDLTSRLAAEGQCLPVDVPQSQRATLGGVIATNTSGPRRFGFGTIRDHVIGIAAVDGTGRLFHAGGRVVKNVAGYDLCKLVVGSRGRLAILTTITLKLRPRPEALAFLWYPAAALDAVDAALERLVTSGTRPVVLDVLSAGAADIVSGTVPSAPDGAPALVVGFAGTADEVGWQLETAAAELAALLGNGPVRLVGDEADAALDALVDFQVRSDDPLVVKLTTTPSRTIPLLERATSLGLHVQAHAGNGVMYGHFDDTDPERAGGLVRELRAEVVGSGGNVVVHGCDPEWHRHFDIDGAPEQAWPLAKRLKEALDPHGVLNPQTGTGWSG